jgi:hypothetical protein
MGGGLQIILISDRLARARSVTLATRHLLASAILALAVMLAGTAALYWLTLRYAIELPIPAFQKLVLAAQRAEAERSRASLGRSCSPLWRRIRFTPAHVTDIPPWPP